MKRRQLPLFQNCPLYSERPNIQGALTWIQPTNIQAGSNGALFWQHASNIQTVSKTLSDIGNQADIGFSAQRHSAIYRDDITTVRPEAFRAYCLIRYA